MSTVPMVESPLTRMPRLGFGTWPLRGAEGQRAVESAIGLGYRHIDTAEMYGNEVEVGAGIAASGVARDELYLTTKVWWSHPTGDDFRRAFDACLERLKQPYVDLLLVHWPSPELDLPSVLAAQARILAEGRARAVGVANFPLGLLKRAVEAEIAPIAALQVEHHVYLSQRRLLDYTQPRNIVLTSYTPVAKGEVARDPVLLRIAARHGATAAQVSLAYLLAQPGVAAIPKAASPARQAENLAATALRLDPAELAEIAGLARGLRLVNPGFAPDWNS
jgi:2,5-diketo-D-gluconate reductase B